MNRKNSLADKMRDFVDGKGFYVVVLLCVAAVGISGWYLVRSMTGEEGEPLAPVTATAPVEEASSAQNVENGPVSAPAEIAAPSLLPDAAEKATEPVTEPVTPTPVEEPEKSDRLTVNEAPLVYTWPVKGEVVTGHSLEDLVFDETMGDWRVHTGVDIAAAQGTKVLATAAGTVSAVDQHDLLGTTVVIDHGQGMVSCYSNLQGVPTVEVGDSVYTGSIIGSVGNTAISESAAVSHLHFELMKEGTAVDPLEYLPQQQ